MSADFWAGYISGAAGIVLGNPLDVLKVRLQAGLSSSSSHTQISPSVTSPPTSLTPSGSPISQRLNPQSLPSAASSYFRPFLVGTAAPVLGYGALNALLFVSYNRTEAFLNDLLCTGGGSGGRGTNLLTTWLAGAVGGLATWVVSAPTELVKCRAQLRGQQIPSPYPGPFASPQPASPPPSSSWHITKDILKTHGVRGLYKGGTVTALRDSIGYGFYFWGYELCTRWFPSPSPTYNSNTGASNLLTSDAARVLLCGGLAGIITWASIFPLDVIKTRVQTQIQTQIQQGTNSERTSLLAGGTRPPESKSPGAWEVARETYRQGGLRPFFRGLGVCSVRAFIVNAVQWAVYEWIMAELGEGRAKRQAVRGDVGGEVGVFVG
ncbi:mitochondrial carrier domain-containing protein [Dichotomopilus funicola]|uniref:Mitochondrial carrier domain-containing protein n=1 Tax=Dichotomopilus funicola TaxID=1934379 RepID=A0AAN6ZQK4_9PEZI|nr:mitochondrial carrier domain-containing protein [Dichotomopilus funicola]